MTVQPGQTASTALRVTVPVGAAADTTGFRVLAATADGAQDSVEGQLTVSSKVSLPTQAMNLQLSPTQASAGQGTPATYQITVTNVGNVADTYQLIGSFPAGFAASFTSGSPGFTPASSSAGPTIDRRAGLEQRHSRSAHTHPSAGKRNGKSTVHGIGHFDRELRGHGLRPEAWSTCRRTVSAWP